MSAVTRPQGPLPARVYWVRRAVVLGAALLLVVTFAQILGGGSDGSSGDPDQAAQVAADASDAATGTASTATAPATRAKDTRNGDAKGKKGKKPAAPPLAEPDGPCDPADLTVRPTIQRAAAGGRIRIPIEIHGTDEACTWQVSPQSLAVKITSGRDQIWSSQQCRGVPSGQVVVRSAKPARVAMVWNGRRSDRDCSRVATWALPGWYHVVAAALGGDPTDQQFVLTAPPRPTVTKTAEPKKSKQTRKPGSGESRPTDEPVGPRDGASEPNG
jgi:hypothetical protein